MLAKPTTTDAHGEHVVPLKIYLGVAGSLFFLTMLTLAMSYVDLGPYNMLVAMLIAGLKASLVALIFMHLLWDNKFLMTIFLTALLFLAIFIGITLMDTLHRGDIYQQSAGPIHPQSEMYTKEDTTKASSAEGNEMPAQKPAIDTTKTNTVQATTQSAVDKAQKTTENRKNTATQEQAKSKTDSGEAPK